jgi:hypothetical protein
MSTRASLTFELQELLENSAVLNPKLVKIKNESYWYHMRKALTPKKQMAITVKQNNMNSMWESYIYQWKVLESSGNMNTSLRLSCWCLLY